MKPALCTSNSADISPPWLSASTPSFLAFTTHLQPEMYVIHLRNGGLSFIENGALKRVAHHLRVMLKLQFHIGAQQAILQVFIRHRTQESLSFPVYS